MIKRRESMTQTVREKLRGGNGALQLTNIFEGDELEKTRLFAVMNVEPGCSIGIHPHDQEGEVYLILEGAATVTEDGVDYILHAGDAEYCTGGHTHGLLNHTDRPLKLLAIVMK